MKAKAQRARLPGVLASTSDSADSGLIHSSLGAANRLAVIRRGDQYEYSRISGVGRATHPKDHSHDLA